MKFFKQLALTTALAALAATASAQTANVTPTTVAVSGTNVTANLVSAAGVMYVPNDGRTLLAIRGGGTAVTATVISQKTALYKEGFGNITIGNETVSVPSASVVLVGPFPPGRFNTTTGVTTVSMSSVTGVSATALKVPQ